MLGEANYSPLRKAIFVAKVTLSRRAKGTKDDDLLLHCLYTYTREIERGGGGGGERKGDQERLMQRKEDMSSHFF